MLRCNKMTGGACKDQRKYKRKLVCEMESEVARRVSRADEQGLIATLCGAALTAAPAPGTSQ
jgi:hypothetical protein